MDNFTIHFYVPKSKFEREFMSYFTLCTKDNKSKVIGFKDKYNKYKSIYIKINY